MNSVCDVEAGDRGQKDLRRVGFRKKSIIRTGTEEGRKKSLTRRKLSLEELARLADQHQGRQALPSQAKLKTPVPPQRVRKPVPVPPSKPAKPAVAPAAQRVPQSAPKASRPTSTADLKLVVLGLDARENRLLNTIITIFKRRTPSITLLDKERIREADVILINFLDKQEYQWAQQQPWLKEKPVGWIDGTGEFPANHMTISRPIMWPTLPTMLSKILFNAEDSTKRDDRGKREQALQKLKSGKTPVTRRAGAEESVERRPAGSAAGASVGQAAPAVASPASPAQVLVVDDSLAVRDYMTSILGDYNTLHLTCVDSGDVALELCTKEQFSCIFLDVLMPGIDGYETCRRIKALPLNRDTNVIMLTGRTSPFDRIRSKMAGCNAYLTKPVDVDLLKETLADFTGLSFM